ncbi:MAG: hypothetical protein ACHQT7_02865, partial [Candidatus Levyibacteriota bacterium]
RLAGLAPILPLEGLIGRLPERPARFKPPPIIMTGFEPFILGEDWNSSTTIVKLFQEQYRNSKKPIPEMFFLPNLPSNINDSDKDARQIEELIRVKCPNGAIILSLGEDLDIPSNIAARIESQSRYAPTVEAFFPSPEFLTRWQLSDTLCLKLLKNINEDNHQKIFGPNSNVSVQLTIGEDTATGSECEKLLTVMNELSWNQARKPKPIPILPIFIHVPGKKQPDASTINVIRAVIQIATLYFEKYKDHPEEFVTRFAPEELLTVN